MSNPNPQDGFQKHPENINRKGRPPKELSLTSALLKKISKDKIADMLIALARGHAECPECGAEVEVPKDAATVRYMWDHVDGKPVQKQILSTESEEPFEIQITQKKAE